MSGHIELSDRHITTLAEQVLLACGMGTVLVIGSNAGRLVAALRATGIGATAASLPFAAEDGQRRQSGTLDAGDDAFRTIVVLASAGDIPADGVRPFLSELSRVGTKVLLHLARVDDDRDRGWWETRCFEAGFRKDPAYYVLNSYASLQFEGPFLVVPLEKLPLAARERFPLSFLRAERDLHMDMLRESGSRSDAHVARYHLAAGYLRAGDRVLDAACGLGYGSHVLANLARGISVLGIDNSETCIAYAEANFRARQLRFRCGELPSCLTEIADGSIDAIVCFETLEHVAEPRAVLREFGRILSPGGRLVASVPNDWTDETGTDPNPYHLQVYDQRKFLEELREVFEIEALIGQTADRAKKAGGRAEWVPRPRAFEARDPDRESDDREAEWLIAVACTSPLAGDAVPYIERAFSPSEVDAAGNALSFARDYANPWLIRSLVSIGFRTQNSALRERWAKEVLRRAPPSGADAGAALAVRAYAALERGAESLDPDLTRAIESYVEDAAESANPSVLRWRISLCFVLGVSSLRAGLRDEAARLFEQVLALPVGAYSPTLLTKTAEAAFLLGMIHCSNGAVGKARCVWRDAFRAVAAEIQHNLMPDASAVPPEFYVKEVADALSVAGRMVALAGVVEDEASAPFVAHVARSYDSVSLVRSLAAEIEALRTAGDTRAMPAADELRWMREQRDAWAAEAALRDERLIQSSADYRWMQEQRDTWAAEAAARDERLARLNTDYRWMQEQRDTWEAEAARRDERLARLNADYRWMQEQRNAWEAEAARREEGLVRLSADYRWMQEQRDAWAAKATLDAEPGYGVAAARRPSVARGEPE